MILPATLFAQPPSANKGILDLQQYDFHENGPVSIGGEWEFYMSELVQPEEFKSSNKPPPDYIDFPSTWNDISKARNPGHGYATYHLRILTKAPQSLSIGLPHFYSNYRVWINQKLIAFNGTVGTSESTSSPQWLPQTVAFEADSDTLDFVIHISNFHHAKGGVREPVLLGLSDQLDVRHTVAVNSNLVMFASLMVISLALVLIFLFMKNEVSVLYMAALCITWAIRSVFSNLYIANSFFPDFPWELCLKIEYITLFLMMIWAVLFLSSVFKNDGKVSFKYMLCICNGVFILITIFFDATLYTQFLPVYLSFCGIVLVYVIYILIRALMYEREGVWLMIACLFLSVILFSYDLLSYEGLATFNPIIINVGYLTIFVLVALGLSYQLGLLKKTSPYRNVLTYEDLYGSQKEVKK